MGKQSIDRVSKFNPSDFQLLTDFEFEGVQAPIVLRGTELNGVLRAADVPDPDNG